MTILGGIVMAMGIALSLLSAFGVWRFPTAIARMHAATKSASLGLALVVLGAGIASSSPRIVGIGLLTTALLFLTAPISGHLLGRASYLTGAEQYRVDALKDVLTAPLEVEPSGSPDFSVTRWLGLIGVWVLLWRDFSIGSFLGGAAVTFLIELTRSSVASPRPIRLGALARFAVYYLAALIRTNARVAWEVATPLQDDIDEAIVGIPLTVESPQAALLVANAVTFTPGTLTIELSGEPLTLYAHVLHFEGEAELQSEISRLEKMADAIFARR
jgi:multicomponent Na+:H+ antiporter subunit E